MAYDLIVSVTWNFTNSYTRPLPLSLPLHSIIHVRWRQSILRSNESAYAIIREI